VNTGPRSAARRAAAQPIPLSLYVHVPWCVRKCPYCDFNSHTADEVIDEAGYIDALLVDLEHELHRQPLSAVRSVFIGGGTPSLFAAAAIGRLLEGIDARIGLAGNAEITLEANPGTAEATRFAGYRAAGVNRLSIGVQSLDDTRLRALGRIHSAREARAAVAMARAAGFDNLNLDLMYGLPTTSPGISSRWSPTPCSIIDRRPACPTTTGWATSCRPARHGSRRAVVTSTRSRPTHATAAPVRIIATTGSSATISASGRVRTVS
jgi:hypothetical protein